MQFHVSETCPKCREPISIATIERHRTPADLALHNFECAQCGPVMTKLIPLRAPDTSAA